MFNLSNVFVHLPDVYRKTDIMNLQFFDDIGGIEVN